MMKTKKKAKVQKESCPFTGETLSPELDANICALDGYKVVLLVKILTISLFLNLYKYLKPYIKFADLDH